MDRHTEQYRQQPDPADPSIPLAWKFTDMGSRVGRTPPNQFGKYRKLIIGLDEWFVHCSFAGALHFVFEMLGEGNVEINEATGTGRLTVHEDMKGSWIGRNGCVVGFLKNMLDLRDLRIIGVASWQRH